MPTTPHAQTNSYDEAETLRTLNAFAVDMIAIPSVEDLLWYVARNVVGRLNFVDCVIYRALSEERELVQVAALGDKNPFGRNILNPLRIPFGHGITGKVAHSRQPIIVDDLLKDQNYIPDAQPARSEICVPLVWRNKLVGVIDSEHPSPNAFGQAELEVLTTIAAMTSAKLELLAEAERSALRYQDLLTSHAQLNHETTNRKALEAELFNARKLESVGRLTGRFAHEFNNILTVISGNLELIEGDISDPASQESLSDAQSAVQRGSTLIQDMLAFSQRTHLSPETRDLNALVENVCNQAKRSGEESLKISYADNLPTVRVDPAAFANAFNHLIKNARDAMPDGGPIEISTAAVTHAVSDIRGLTTPLHAGDYIRISVRDFGPGIDQKKLQQVFDPFFTTKPVGSGTGLGLSMILGFMQQSGGTVAVNAPSGGGARVCLYFPVPTGA